MGRFGDEFFGPIRQGLSDIREGYNQAEERRMKKRHQDDEVKVKRDELAQKVAKDKEEADARERFAQAAQHSKLAADPALAGAAVRAGKDPGVAMKPKVDTDTLSKFKMMLMEKYLGNLSQAGNGADPGAVMTEQDGIADLLGVTSGVEKRQKGAEEAYNLLKQSISDPKKRDRVVAETKDLLSTTLIPYYRDAGVPEEILVGMQQDVPKYLRTIALGASNPIDAMLQADAPTLNALHQKYDERMNMYDNFGTMSSADLKKFREQHFKDLDDFGRAALDQATLLRGMSDSTERVGGKPIDNVFGNMPLEERTWRKESLPPEQDLKNRLSKRKEQRLQDLRSGAGSAPASSQPPSRPSVLKEEPAQPGRKPKIGDKVSPPQDVLDQNNKDKKKPGGIGIFLQ